MLTNVIVEPSGLTVDDFDNFEELNEVIGFAREVMTGEVKPAEEKRTRKAAE